MNRLPYLLVIPATIIILLVGAYPILFSLLLSLSSFSIVNPQIEVVGFHNYIGALLDPIFWNSAGVTLLYVVGSLVVEFSVGIILGMALIGDFRGKTIFHSILIVPLAVSPIVLGILSSPVEIWDDINTLLYYGTGLGLYIDLFQPVTYYSVIILADAWLWSPLFMLVVIAIVQGIPKEQFEAANIHGASDFQTFSKITFPAIFRSPVMGFVLVLRAIDSFKAFEIPYAWTFWLGLDDLGTPVDTFGVLMWKLLTSSVYDFPLARIAAISIMTTFIALVFAAITLRICGKTWSE